MKIELVRYQDDRREAWESVVANSLNGALLHTRRFLSHQGDRFSDFSFLVSEKGRFVGVVPLARDHQTESAISHPGISYGGIVHNGELRGERMKETIHQLVQRCRDASMRLLIYRSIPLIYQATPMQDDEWYLIDQGATVRQTDINSVSLLPQAIPFSARRARHLRQAKGVSVDFHRSLDRLDDFHQILVRQLWERHAVGPTHTAIELKEIILSFPDQVRLYLALDGSRVVAGALIFLTPNAWHAQYIATDIETAPRGSLDAVLYRCMRDAESAQVNFFSLGISNVGAELNQGLNQFKTEFGTGGLLHRTYELAL